ncbi:hypothetical protein D3OALGB2SA_5706 [Olavius algarvensis associated proteobacterium Delta 3]|nr:hypothetical protein D3OALGB2SA_5706 [Olavius algarvensis associated proteobacterium Delta 3]
MPCARLRRERIVRDTIKKDADWSVMAEARSRGWRDPMWAASTDCGKPLKQADAFAASLVAMEPTENNPHA